MGTTLTQLTSATEKFNNGTLEDKKTGVVCFRLEPHFKRWAAKARRILLVATNKEREESSDR